MDDDVQKTIQFVNGSDLFAFLALNAFHPPPHPPPPPPPPPPTPGRSLSGCVPFQGERRLAMSLMASIAQSLSDIQGNVFIDFAMYRVRSLHPYEAY